MLLQPYKCPEENCGKEFCKNRTYIDHIRFTHSTVNNEKYKCTYDGCSREYGVVDSLKRHVNQFHLGVARVVRNNKYICEECGRSFTTTFNLKVCTSTHNVLPRAKHCLFSLSKQNHAFQHSGIRPFGCKVSNEFRLYQNNAISDDDKIVSFLFIRCFDTH